MNRIQGLESIALFLEESSKALGVTSKVHSRLLPTTVHSLSNNGGKARLKYHIPHPARKPEALLHSRRSVMIEMVLLHVAKIWAAEVVEVYGVMNPLFDGIALDNTCQKHRSGVERKEHADGESECKQWQKVVQLCADVHSIVRALVVLPVYRVKILVC